jgi:hypothetical protein
MREHYVQRASFVTGSYSGPLNRGLPRPLLQRQSPTGRASQLWCSWGLACFATLLIGPAGAGAGGQSPRGV